MHMALLDLDKIIIKRTIVGIRCTSCGGSLEVAKKKINDRPLYKTGFFWNYKTKKLRMRTL